MDAFELSDYPLNLIKVGLVKKLISESFVVWASKLTMAKVVQYVPKCIILVKKTIDQIARHCFRKIGQVQERIIFRCDCFVLFFWVVYPF